jgi:Family of unknown function (DUF6209)
MLHRLIAFVVVSSLALACDPVDDGDAPFGDEPAVGKADGTDTAERGCKVVLRSFGRLPRGTGFEVANGTWVWQAEVDVDATLANSGASIEALYSANGAAWRVFRGTRLAGAPDAAGRVRYQIRVDRQTVPTPQMEPRSWEFQRAELAVYAAVPGRGRLFDHNRETSDLANYVLSPTNNFQIGLAPAICPATTPRAVLTFDAAFTQRQRGTIVPGGTVTVNYDLSRLPRCRYSRGGAQLWDIEATIKFQPMGTTVARSVTQVVPGGRVSVPVDFAVPLGTQYVDLWFHNTEGEQRCDEYDSNFGNNYRFGAGPLPAAPTWAGNWGSSLARDCLARPGVPEPLVIDSYVRERACSFVEAEVYAPGFTDGADQRLERMWAQAVPTIGGVEKAPIDLESVGRTGNNWRYRFTLPYEYRQVGFAGASYFLRFSADGRTWFQVGQGAGPSGGAARTIVAR